MKKSLIALAALAAVGASFAQVTITGNLGLSWQQDPLIYGDPAVSGTAATSNVNTNNLLPLANGGHNQGLRMNDGEIYLTATEDLGKGYSFTARGGMTMRGRQTTVLDRDGTLTLAAPWGSLLAGSFRTCGSLMGVASGVVDGPSYAANEGNNYVPLDKCSMVDALALTVMVMPGVTLAGTYGEFGAPVTSTSNTGTSGTGNATGIAFWDLTPQYKAGPWLIGMNYTQFIGVGTGSLALFQGSPQFNGVVRTRYYASYDAGIAKFGLGLQQKSGGSADQYIASMSAPLNFLSPALTMGIDYQARGAQGAYDKSNDGAILQQTADYLAWALGNAREGDLASSALGFGLKYAFSKTLSLTGSYITYTDAGANNRCGPNRNSGTSSPTTAVNVSASTTAATSATSICPTANTAANNFSKTAAALDTEYRIRLLKTF